MKVWEIRQLVKEKAHNGITETLSFGIFKDHYLKTIISQELIPVRKTWLVTRANLTDFKLFLITEENRSEIYDEVPF